MRGSGLWTGLQQRAVALEVDYVGVDVWDGVQQVKAWGVGSGYVGVGVWDGECS